MITIDEIELANVQWARGHKARIWFLRPWLRFDGTPPYIPKVIAGEPTGLELLKSRPSNRHQKDLIVVFLREVLPCLEAQAWMVCYCRNLRRQGSSMVNVSNALLILRPVLKVHADAHGMFATTLVTRNVNRILRHGNSFRHYLPPCWVNANENFEVEET